MALLAAHCCDFDSVYLRFDGFVLLGEIIMIENKGFEVPNTLVVSVLLLAVIGLICLVRRFLGV